MTLKASLVHVFASAFVVMIATAPFAACAQTTTLIPAQPGAVLFTPQELEQLVAPIALYPDQLLGHVLIAATYPFEVVQAARWVRDPDNATLRGDALSAALAGIDWDPSVKSLVPFPQVLETMDANLDWMQQLGNAFLAQEADVMDAVQRLRRRALADGRLKSTAQHVIILEGGIIVIRPARPDVIYVPYYDPYIVYDPWPYPAYPPYYFPPPPAYYIEASIFPGFYYFAGGVIVVHWLWGWHRWDWHRHRIHIDVHRFNVINIHQRPIKRDVWVHDPHHRRSVPYPTPTVAKRFEPSYRPAPDTRREFRGFEYVERPTPPVAPRKGTPPPRVKPPKSALPRPSPPGTPRVVWPKNAVPPSRPPAKAPRTVPPVTSAPRPAPPVRAPHVVPPKTTVPRSTRPAQVPRAAVPRPVPPVFEDYSRGADVRREAERGRQSRQPQTTHKAVPRANVPSSRTRPSGPAPRSSSRPQHQPKQPPSGKPHR